MSDKLEDFNDDELINELRRRGKEVLTEERTCSGCNHYNARYVAYSHHYPEWHCNGCNKTENKCVCR